MRAASYLLHPSSCHHNDNNLDHKEIMIMEEAEKSNWLEYDNECKSKDESESKLESKNGEDED